MGEYMTEEKSKTQLTKELADFYTGLDDSLSPDLKFQAAIEFAQASEDYAGVETGTLIKQVRGRLIYSGVYEKVENKAAKKPAKDTGPRKGEILNLVFPDGFPESAINMKKADLLALPEYFGIVNDDAQAILDKYYQD